MFCSEEGLKDQIGIQVCAYPSSSSSELSPSKLPSRELISPLLASSSLIQTYSGSSTDAGSSSVFFAFPSSLP